jgi:hypothetical protein
MGGGTPAMFGQGSQPGNVGTPPQPMPQNIASRVQIPTWRSIVPKEVAALAMASDDPAGALRSVIDKYSEVKLVNGVAMTHTGMPIYKMEDSGMQTFTPGGAPA